MMFVSRHAVHMLQELFYGMIVMGGWFGRSDFQPDHDGSWPTAYRHASHHLQWLHERQPTCLWADVVPGWVWCSDDSALYLQNLHPSSTAPLTIQLYNASGNLASTITDTPAAWGSKRD